MKSPPKGVSCFPSSWFVTVVFLRSTFMLFELLVKAGTGSCGAYVTNILFVIISTGLECQHMYFESSLWVRLTQSAI